MNLKCKFLLIIMTEWCKEDVLDFQQWGSGTNSEYNWKVKSTKTLRVRIPLFCVSFGGGCFYLPGGSTRATQW